MRETNGEETAARLYDEHGDRVYRFCYRLCGNTTEAEDIAAETFFAALDSKFRGEADELTFLYRIALNKWRMHCRRQSIRRRLQGFVGLGQGPKTVERLALDEAIDALPLNLRLALVLVKVEGFTNREAAALLKCPIGTVQSRVFKACETLRVALSEAPPEQTPALTPAKENGK